MYVHKQVGPNGSPNIICCVLDCYLYRMFVCVDLNRKVTVVFWFRICSISTDLFSCTNIHGASIGSTPKVEELTHPVKALQLSTLIHILHPLIVLLMSLIHVTKRK